MGLRFAFSIDLDWASEHVIKKALDIFENNNVPITIFITHHSEIVESYRGTKEIEVHPNFCEKSSHGKNYQEIYAYCDKIVGEKTGFRCHKYYENNDINEYFYMQGYKYSSNICTDMEYVAPFYNRSGLLAIPIFMEDGGFLKREYPISMQSVINKLPLEGTVIFNFHPMHIVFNSYNFIDMRKFKDSMSREEYTNIQDKIINTNRNTKYGISNLLEELINYTKQNDIECVLLKTVWSEHNAKNMCF